LEFRTIASAAAEVEALLVVLVYLCPRVRTHRPGAHSNESVDVAGDA
jgi:hypothetical protein